MQAARIRPMVSGSSFASLKAGMIIEIFKLQYRVPGFPMLLLGAHPMEQIHRVMKLKAVDGLRSN